MSSTPFCPVPPETPITSKGIDPLPSAGPYYVASHAAGRSLVLRRNPNYGGSRPQELREISYRFGVSPERALRRRRRRPRRLLRAQSICLGRGVERHRYRVDERFGPASEAARAGAQPGVCPEPSTERALLRLQRDPRAVRPSADLRRAVNYAIDRRALATNTGVGQLGRPSDQYLPAGGPGLRRHPRIPAWRSGSSDRAPTCGRVQRRCGPLHL